MSRPHLFPPEPQPTRRDFVRTASLAAAAVAAGPAVSAATPSKPARAQDPAFRVLCMFALDGARSAGASYADVRVVRRRQQRVETRDERVSNLSDQESLGIGVRVLVDGAWGFAATHRLTRDDAAATARAAVEQARANASVAQRAVVLAPVRGYPAGEWRSPIDTDPFEVPLEEKTMLLLGANAAAASVRGVGLVTSSLYFEQVQTTFASTAGSIIEQTVYRTWPRMTVTAIAADRSSFQTRESGEVPPMGLGYEHVRGADLEGRAPQWAEEAVRKLTAPSVEPGTYDLILDPSNLFLTVHETIGHATELDRAMGLEANFAGTSFLAPPEQVLRRFRYGPEFMNVQGDRTQPGGLATVGWDDEGVPADAWPIVKDGVLVDYQTTREQAPWVSEWTGITRSHGCAHAESWDRPPLQRMPNVSLLPGEVEYSLDDLVAATDRGLLLLGRGSYSIDQQRYDFQFGGQACYEIRNGQVQGLVRDVAYTGRTPEFWNSLDMLGGPRSYRIGGTLSDGKGQPAQANAASHGCPPARFRGVRVLNTQGGG